MTENRWKPAFWVLITYGVLDGILALTNNMTVSQLAYNAGQRNYWYIVGTGIFLVWLFVHLFWRWKRVWKWLRAKDQKERDKVMAE